jgi:phage tail protein X
VTETVLAANPGLAALGPVLPMGTAMTMPDLPKKTTARPLISLWA